MRHALPDEYTGCPAWRKTAGMVGARAMMDATMGQNLRKISLKSPLELALIAQGSAWFSRLLDWQIGHEKKSGLFAQTTSQKHRLLFSISRLITCGTTNQSIMQVGPMDMTLTRVKEPAAYFYF